MEITLNVELYENEDTLEVLGEILKKLNELEIYKGKKREAVLTKVEF